MSYLVAHARKVPTAVGLRNVAAHNCREAVYDDSWKALGDLPEYISHPERAAMNEGDRCGGVAVLARRSDRIKAADLTRKPQKNASAAVEFAISASPDWFASHPPEDWKRYFQDCRKFLDARYGRANVLHWATHYDEKTPHMHVLLAPIVQGSKGLKYSSGEFLGGRGGLRELQDELAVQVGRKWGLERGREGSKARHTDQYTWAASLEVREDHMASREEAVARREGGVAQREKAVAAQEAHLAKLAEVKLEPFEPVLQRKKKIALTQYVASDGADFSHYADYERHEKGIQAIQYAQKVFEVAQATQHRALQVEADAKQLPRAMQRVRELDAQVSSFANLSPKELRSIADQREAAIVKRQQQQKDNSRGR